MYVTASFDTRIIEHWQVKKLVEQFNFVLQQLAKSDSQTKVADIDNFTAEDRQEIWTWNREMPTSVERCVREFFAAQVSIQFDALAVCAWDGEITYGELDHLSSKLAGHLVALGVKPDDIVPLCFEKSMWTIVAMLGVLKAGGAFLPLDSDLPENRYRDIFKQVGAHVLLTSAEHSMRWGNSGPAIVTVNKSSIAQLPIPVDQVHSAVKPSNLASSFHVLEAQGSRKEL